MGLFITATIHESNDARLKDRIVKLFPENNYEIGRGQWLISFGGTAKELYEKISPDVPSSELPAGASAVQPLSGTVVFGIGGYFGRASRDMWEWMTTKLGGKVG